MGAAFFDVDDTILRGSSGVMLAKYLLLKKGETTTPGYLLDMAKAYIFSKTGSFEYDGLIEKGLSQFAGRTKVEFEQIGQGCFDDYMRPNIYRMAYNEIRMHRSRGNPVVLLTASLQPIIEPLAEFLDVDETFALKIRYEDGEITPTVEKPLSYEEGKLILARGYCQERGIDLKDCWFYSDSSSDLPLMEQVGHPMPTNPDPLLRRIALLRNWRIKKFCSVLPPGFRPDHWR
jgi:HAD superfamily hydrolase (TIGR01490 family)